MLLINWSRNKMYQYILIYQCMIKVSKYNIGNKNLNVKIKLIFFSREKLFINIWTCTKVHSKT
jgi:hypothetical protein